MEDDSEQDGEILEGKVTQLKYSLFCGDKMKQNVQLEKDKEELEQKLKHMQKDLNRLQRKSYALDGLATLAEATMIL